MSAATADAVDTWAAARWLRRLVLPAVRKAVTRVLVDHCCNLTGYCRLKLATIASEAGYSIRACRKALRELEATGLIWTHFRAKRCSEYWVRFGAPQAPTEPPVNPPKPVREPRQAELDLGLKPASGAASMRHEAPPELILPELRVSKNPSLRSEREGALTAKQADEIFIPEGKQGSAEPAPAAPTEAKQTAQDATTRMPSSPPKRAIWTEGVAIVQRLTDRPAASCKRLLGKALRILEDDHAGLYQLLIQVEQDRPVAPEDFIFGAVHDRARRRTAFAETLATPAAPLVRAALLGDDPAHLQELQEARRAVIAWARAVQRGEAVGAAPSLCPGWPPGMCKFDAAATVEAKLAALTSNPLYRDALRDPWPDKAAAS